MTIRRVYIKDLQDIKDKLLLFKYKPYIPEEEWNEVIGKLNYLISGNIKISVPIPTIF